MSQTQPLACAVEIVCEAIGACSLAYGTCNASAESQNNTCFCETKPMP